MWLHIPSTHLASAPAPAGSSSDCPSPTSECAPYVTSSGKPTPRPASWRGWKTRPWITRLSGMMSPPSMLDAGAESWISSLRATRASPTASPARDSGLTTIDGCSITSCGSSTTAGLIVSSARTCRGTRPDKSGLSSQDWKRWAAALRAEYSARPKPAPATGGNGCSSWPTARGGDGAKGGPNQRDGSGSLHLTSAANRWPSPSMTDGNRGDYTRDNGDPDRERPSLSGLAKQWASPKVVQGGANPKSKGQTGQDLQAQVANWPTPSARDHKGSLPLDARNRTMGTLDEAAERKFRFTPPDLTIWDGRMSSTLIPCLSRPPTVCGCGALRAEISVYRRWSINPSGTGETGAAGWRGIWIRKPRALLNPRFVEFLMCWPIGWTGCALPVTDATRYKSRMRTELSTLCSPPIRAQGSML